MSAAPRSPRPGAPSSNAERPNGRLLTAGDLAERWQVPTGQVYRLARDGRLPVVRLGRYYRFALQAVEGFEEEGGTHAG